MERRIQVLNEAGLFMGQLALRMKHDAICDIMGNEMPLQDYLAEELGEARLDQDDPLCCLQYAAKVLETLQKAYKHIEQGLDMGLTLEERQVADMLWGFAPHKWPEDLKKVANEVTKVILHKIKNCPNFRNEANRRQYVNGIIDDVKDICDKHAFPVEMREDGFIGLELLYIRDWVLNKLNK